MRLIAAEPQLRSVDAALVGGAVVAAGSAAVNWATGFQCPLYGATGCWCAFCGSTRAAESILAGNLETALRDNGLVVLVTLLVLVRLAVRRFGGHVVVTTVDGWLERVDLRVWTSLLLAWTIVRNLPGLWFLGPAR